MRVICAMCKTFIREVGEPSEMVSHGLCPICGKIALEEARRMARERAGEKEEPHADR